MRHILYTVYIYISHLLFRMIILNSKKKATFFYLFVKPAPLTHPPTNSPFLSKMQNAIYQYPSSNKSTYINMHTPTICSYIYIYINKYISHPIFSYVLSKNKTHSNSFFFLLINIFFSYQKQTILLYILFLH